MPFEYEKHVPSRAEIVVGMAADAWRRWRNWREFAQFVEFFPDEADRMAHDLNIDKASLMAIAKRGSEQPLLVKRRLRLLGIDPEHIRRTDPGVAQDLDRCCALCDVRTRCARDMARRPDSSAWRGYCPNRPTLDALCASHDGFSTAH